MFKIEVTTKITDTENSDNSICLITQSTTDNIEERNRLCIKLLDDNITEVIKHFKFEGKPKFTFEQLQKIYPDLLGDSKS